MDRYMLHQPNLAALTRSANGGCEFCKLIARAFYTKPQEGKLVYLTVHQLDTRPDVSEWLQGKRKVRDPSANFTLVPNDSWGYVRVRCGDVRGEIPLHDFDGERIISE